MIRLCLPNASMNFLHLLIINVIFFIILNEKIKLDCYFAIPDSFAKRKEDAHIFAGYMKPFIGNYQVIYTRNESGRKILLEAGLAL